MATITPEQWRRAFDLGCSVYDGELDSSLAVAELVDDFGMNRSSALATVRNLRHMLDGVVYKWTLKEDATREFLERILARYGIAKARNAIKAVRLHVDYYPGGPLPGVSAIVDAFETSIDLATTSREEFDNAVDVLRLKQKNLSEPKGSASPAKATMTVQSFLRDVAVAAFVQQRANGVCERCGQLAPFKKKSSGLPYLEVHHKIPLAHDGPDTVENAIAVCPNCHREAHFG